MRVGKVINRYKMAKHFVTEITDERFTFRRNEEKILAEQQPDGIYTVRSNVEPERFDAAQTVRAYKDLATADPVPYTGRNGDGNEPGRWVTTINVGGDFGFPRGRWASVLSAPEPDPEQRGTTPNGYHMSFHTKHPRAVDAAVDATFAL